MAVIRRHPGIFSSVGFCLLVGVIVFLNLGRHGISTAAARVADDPPPGNPPAYSVVGPVEAGDVARLRTETALDNESLAALNLSGDAATAVLAGIRSWYETNVASWQAKASAVADQQGLLRAYEGAVARGAQTELDPNAIRQALTAAQSDYATTLGGLRQAALGGLNENQHSLADLMYARKGVSMPYRAVSLTGDQDTALRKLRQRCAQQIDNAASTEAKQAAAQQFGDSLPSTIGSGNCDALSQMASYMGGASERLVNAEATVFPPPVDNPPPQ